MLTNQRRIELAETFFAIIDEELVAERVCEVVK